MSPEVMEKLFNYDIKSRPQQSCLNMGSMRVEGDIRAGDVKTRRLLIRQNLKSTSNMEVKKVLAKGGVWEKLITDQLESMSDQIDIQGDVYISTLQTDSLHFESFISIDENDTTHH